MSFLFCLNDAMAMAIFVAQLVREGVTFDVRRSPDGFVITLTGGF